MNEFSILLERLSALKRNMMRKFAADKALQMVHVEILSYLSRCNRYSNTTQALAEYLGQTKGSISQSLGLLEEKALVKRVQDETDRRVFHLHLTAKARGLMGDYETHYGINMSSVSDVDSLISILRKNQQKHGFREFGICASCKYNVSSGKDQFICGLTKETLSKKEIRQQCREHESA